jgi:hypothetical protein
MFRWFVGLSVDEPVWNPSTFSKNRGTQARQAGILEGHDSVQPGSNQESLAGDGVVSARGSESSSDVRAIGSRWRMHGLKFSALSTNQATTRE